MDYLQLYGYVITITKTKLSISMIALSLIKVLIVDEVLLPLQCLVRPQDEPYGIPKLIIIIRKMA